MAGVRFTRELPDETVEGVTGFLQQVNQSCKGEWYFRGHRQGEQKHLTPSIGRQLHYAGRSATLSAIQERRLLYRFRRHAYKHYGRILTEWEALFLARHHELPVRLLDWSTNPVVALYFASTYESEGHVEDGAVWAIKRREAPV